MTALTESYNPHTENIDHVSTLEVMKMINDEDKKVALAVETQLEAIAQAVDLIVAQFQKWGRLFYFWAGTSGRIWVLDASECPPTFSVDPSLVQGIIAWWDEAIRTSLEGAEDSYEGGQNDAEILTENDVAVVISASWNPQYLLWIIDKAREKHAHLIGLTCNPQGNICDKVDILICPQVWAEVIAWSSRMKAWTAQKMVLNMLSTGVMIKIWKTYKNLMVDLHVSNEKLKSRATSLIVNIANVSFQEAELALQQSNGEVKTAIVSLVKGISIDDARILLENHHWILREIIG